MGSFLHKRNLREVVTGQTRQNRLEMSAYRYARTDNRWFG